MSDRMAAVARAAIAILAAGVLAFALVDSQGSAKAIVDENIPYERQLNGCPLDSVSYRSPTFAYECHRVTDRISGESWWLLRMGVTGDTWVVLPIGDDEWVPEVPLTSTSR